MAEPPAPPLHDRLRPWIGRAAATWATILQRTISGDSIQTAHTRRRDDAIRTAHRNGIPAAELARRLGITEYWVGRIIRGRTNDRRRRRDTPAADTDTTTVDPGTGD